MHPLIVMKLPKKQFLPSAALNEAYFSWASLASSLQENSSDLTDKATKLNNYYENLRTNVMSILGQVREPIIPPPPHSSTPHSSAGGVHNPTGISGVVPNSQDQFDSYLTKLQNICSESSGGGVDPSKSPYCGQPGSTVGTTVSPKTALHAYNSAAKL